MTSDPVILLEERRTALNAVLESKEFSRAPALAKLLKYLCEKTFEGRVHEIKEFSIATEVYGRNESFGETRDSIVHKIRQAVNQRITPAKMDGAAIQVSGVDAEANVKVVIGALQLRREFGLRLRLHKENGAWGVTSADERGY